MGKLRDLTNEPFGRLRVEGLAYVGRNGAVWNCRCACGKLKQVLASNLLGGRTNSCGCLNRELAAARATGRAAYTGEQAERLRRGQCPHCGGASPRKHAVFRGRQRYQCRDCLRHFLSTEAVGERDLRRRELRRALAANPSLAPTLVDYARLFDEESAEVIARSPFFRSFVRPEEMARRMSRNVSRVRYMVKRKRLEVIHVGGLPWVSDQT